MHEIGVAEAGSRLGQLLDWVEAGEEVTITRRGKVVARLVAPANGIREDPRPGVAARIRAMRQGVTLGGLDLQCLIDEGRR